MFPGICRRRRRRRNHVVIQMGRIDSPSWPISARVASGSAMGSTSRRARWVGLCGNSGRTSEPHIHFHVQDSSRILHGAGIRVRFREIAINGAAPGASVPVRGDFVQNLAPAAP